MDYTYYNQLTLTVIKEKYLIYIVEYPMATSPHIWFFIPSKINITKVFIPKGLPLLFYEYLPFQKQILKEVEVTNVTNLVQQFFYINFTKRISIHPVSI